jgi:uncharacterized protein
VRSLFVNLPVRDVAVSRDFFGKLGFAANEQFSDENTACIVVADNICVMLLSHDRFSDFVTDGVADTSRATEVLLAISAESREEVDRLADTALSSGGGEWKPAQDHGFMYGRSFTDPDGHVWETMWMDASATG